MNYRLFLSAAVALPAPVLAEEAAQPDDIVVLASGFEQPAGQTGQAISVINRQRLDELQSATVADALRTLPSLGVAQRGQVGGQTSVFVRGGNSSQTLVLVDGVRVNDPSSPNAAFDFGGLTAGNIARIEVLRGPNSIIWGSQAIGGVVNIETAKPVSGFVVSGGAEYGAWNTARGQANIAGSAGPVRYSLGGSLYRTDGFSMFPGGTERDGSRIGALNGRVRIDLAPNLELDLRGNYGDSRIDTDSSFSGGANSQPVARNRQWLAYAGLNLDLADGRFRSRLAYTRSDVRRRGTDPVTGVYNIYDATGVTDRFEYRGAYDLSDRAQLVAGIEHERIRASTAYETYAPDHARNQLTGGYLQLSLQPFSGLTVTGGVRHDEYSDYGGHTALGGNLAYTPNGGATVLRATYAECFRAPTLSEGQPPYGNPALKPETASNFDIGIEQALLDGRASLIATWFRRRSTNLITYSGGSGQSENIGRADAEGLELGLVLRPTQRLHVEGGYALVNAYSRSGATAGERLPLRPQHTVTFTVDWQTPLGLKLGSTLRLVGDSLSTDDFGSTVPVDGHATVDLRASLPLTGVVEITARVENLTDADYQTVAGYNTPGRAGYVGARVRF